jgi:hypothetical protein
MIGPLSFRATEYLNALRHRKEDVPRYPIGDRGHKLAAWRRARGRA